MHRFIPARAGNTPPTRSRHRACPVHPRAGGEHSTPTDEPSSTRGSSPRGRGTPLGDDLVQVGIRFIPARAGNTPSRPARRPAFSVHPRAGGEHPRRGIAKLGVTGSSPRGRGTLDQKTLHGYLLRFIPARAGNTNVKPPAQGVYTVHPRAGGEHHLIRVSSAPSDGSSPRGRGTLKPVAPSSKERRFIPARAGNTLFVAD